MERAERDRPEHGGGKRMAGTRSSHGVLLEHFVGTDKRCRPAEQRDELATSHVGASLSRVGLPYAQPAAGRRVCLIRGRADAPRLAWEATASRASVRSRPPPAAYLAHHDITRGGRVPPQLLARA